MSAGRGVAERPHGYARYRLDGCRCYVCGFAVSEYERRRQEAIAAGTWRPFVDAGPVREHLAALSAAGIGYKLAAKLAGVSASAVAGVLFGRRGHGPSPRLRRETAERLLAVVAGADGLAPAALVDATGTARRIQALCCVGWSLSVQAERLGWQVGNYARVLDGPRVTVATARAVAGLYDEWSMTPAPAGYSATRARWFAGERCWFPPLAWDDDEIDDPGAVPCLLPPVAGSDLRADELAVQHVMAGHPVELPAVVRDELIRRLTVHGRSLAQIAAVVRTTPKTVAFYRSKLCLTGAALAERRSAAL